MIKKRKRPNYTKEFKQDAIKLVLEQGYSCHEAASRLGIASSNITRWVRLHRQKQENQTESGLSHRDLEEENRRLKKENRRLQMEREILKKAAAFFVKEST